MYVIMAVGLMLLTC